MKRPPPDIPQDSPAPTPVVGRIAPCPGAEGERWRELPAVSLSVTWAPESPWLPLERTRLATRDFRRGYPMTWDLEVPMRRLARPLFLRPGVKRIGPPPPGFELSPSEMPEAPRTEGVSAPGLPPLGEPAPMISAPGTPTTPGSPLPSGAVQGPPATQAPKGSRMKGWSKSAAWLAQDPWDKRP